MRLLYILFLLSLPVWADMGKIVNLELFDNQNPAVITDIQDELDHVVVDVLAAYTEEDNSTVNTRQEQNYQVGLKTYKRMDDWVFYLRLLQTVRGVSSDPTHATSDVTQDFSQVEVGLASTFFDNLDIGLSFSYALEDYNTTTRTHQLGFRYVGERVNIGLVAGAKEKSSDILVKDFQSFISVGLAAGETSGMLFDISATLRPQSSSPAQGTLLEHTQAKTYEGTVQLQGDKNFNRTGFRFDYKKTFSLMVNQADTYSQKFRIHTGMKVQREENSYSIFYISYEKKRQDILIEHQFELGVSLRGFYF